MYSEDRFKNFIPSFILPRRGGGIGGGDGFTMLELIIVLFLITLILGLSSIFFANLLPSSRFNATVRDVSSTIRQAKSLAQIHGNRQIVIIDLDSKSYGIEGYNTKNFPPDTWIKILDPLAGEIQEGKYKFIVHSIGIEGGTIVLWNNKKTVNIQMDPIIGSIVVKAESP
jgi:prepilin-type N-terminal cleavage/methylation domain-containing protein